MAVIGIDLDGTLAKFAKFEGGDIVGEPDQNFVNLLWRLYEEGHDLYIWTCRADYVAESWIKKHYLDMLFCGINCSPYPTDSSKASFDFYIGDEAIRWENNSDLIMSLVKKHVPASDGMARDRSFSSHNPRQYLAGVGKAYVDMFELEWQLAWASKQKFKEIAFLTICSHAKPYSKSYIHTSIRKALWQNNLLTRCDYIHISNAGIVPEHVEMRHPFCAYDWDGRLCTPEQTQYHVEAIERRFEVWSRNYLPKYKKAVIYLRDGGNTCKAIERTLQRLKFPVNVTLVQADCSEHQYPTYVKERDPDDCLTSDENLQMLIDSF